MTLRRVAVGALLAALMASAGFGTYVLLGHFRKAEALRAAPPDPVQVHTSGPQLPGVVYLAQGGDLFALRGGAFTRIATHSGGAGWTMPSLTPDGRLLAVLRGPNSSDIYVLDRGSGAIQGRLTSDEAGKRPSDGSLELNHWAFYPHATADGGTVVFSYDSPKCGFNSGLAIWSLPLPQAGAAITAPPTPRIVPGCSSESGLPQGTRLSTPNQYTGGDVSPVPVPVAGGVVFVRYAVDAQFHVHSTVQYQRGTADAGIALTAADDDCAEPAVSPDGTTLALVCTHGSQAAAVETVALPPLPSSRTTPSSGSSRATASPSASPVAPSVLVGGGLAAFPVWAPDGSGLAYLAPSAAGGGFQLWWLPRTATGAASPVVITDKLDLDATSPPAWSAS